MSKTINTIRLTTKSASPSAKSWLMQTSKVGQLNATGDLQRTVVGNAIEPTEIPELWSDPEYRQEAMEATVHNLIAWQVRVNREERGLTQTQLAVRMGTKQSAISKLEDPDGGDVLVSTLVKAAHAFDCALIIRFVDYQRFADRTEDVGPASLFACPFSDLLPSSAATSFQEIAE